MRFAWNGIHSDYTGDDLYIFQSEGKARCCISFIGQQTGVVFAIVIMLASSVFEFIGGLDGTGYF